MNPRGRIIFLTIVLGLALFALIGSQHKSVAPQIFGGAPHKPPKIFRPPKEETPSAEALSHKWKQQGKFPDKVWHKVGPKGITPEREEVANSWFKLNPTFRHEVLTDLAADTYVFDNYAHRPDILEVWKEVKVPMLKVDLLKYLIMYADGGIWSDLDVVCHTDVSTWVPPEFEDKVNVIAGLEIDWGWEHDDDRLWAQFASWVVMSKPGLKHFDYIINDTVSEINKLAVANNVPLSEINMTMISDVVHLTGPKRLTYGLVAGMSEMVGEQLTDRNVSNLAVPTLFGDVLLLPGKAFAAKTESNRDNPNHGDRVYVEHMYEGSWRNPFGGEKPEEPK